jgi:alkylated DNA repair dioxygenase AlkB
MASRISLTADGLSWVDVYKLPQELIPNKEELAKIWDLHPEEKGKVKIYGKDQTTPRWHQSYLMPYKFSGVEHEALPLPSEVSKYLDFANNSAYVSMNGTVTPFNMCLINWYADGNHYIGFHSDDESEMVKTKEGHSVVYSISFGQTRTFRLKPRANRPDHYSKDILMPHGTVLVMGGACQSTHKHAVPKVAGQKGQMLGRRINLTFRQFKERAPKRKLDDDEGPATKKQKSVQDE